MALKYDKEIGLVISYRIWSGFYVDTLKLLYSYYTGETKLKPKI